MIVRITSKPKKESLSDSELLIHQFASGKKPKQPKPKVLKEIKSSFEDDDNLFDKVGTVCLGGDKREMIAKINQYKNLFPEELKKFKCKKGASEADLIKSVAAQNGRGAGKPIGIS